jgi:hypothetical protein
MLLSNMVSNSYIAYSMAVVPLMAPRYGLVHTPPLPLHATTLTTSLYMCVCMCTQQAIHQAMFSNQHELQVAIKAAIEMATSSDAIA